MDSDSEIMPTLNFIVGGGSEGGRTASCSEGEMSALYSKQASSFFNKNLTNADNDNSMNVSTKMEISLVNKPETMCKLCNMSKYTYKHQ